MFLQFCPASGRANYKPTTVGLFALHAAAGHEGQGTWPAATTPARLSMHLDSRGAAALNCSCIRPMAFSASSKSHCMHRPGAVPINSVGEIVRRNRNRARHWE